MIELRVMRDVCDTVDWFYENITGNGCKEKLESYNELLQRITDNDETDYTVEIAYESPEFFDVRVGDVVFTIHNNDGDFRIDDVAHYVADDEINLAIEL